MRNELAKQRCRELAFEGERWVDLMHDARHNQVEPNTPTTTALDIIVP